MSRPLRSVAALPLTLCLLASVFASQQALAQGCGFAFEDLASLALPAPEPETRLITRDLDGDGRDEILITYPTCPGSVAIVASDGSTLSLLQTLGPPEGLSGSPSGIDAADVDLDGDLDLVVGHLEETGCSDRGVTVFERRLDGTYGGGEFFAGDNDGRHLLAVDLDSSGLPLIVTGDGPVGLNPTTGKAIQVRENEGPGHFDHVHDYGLQPSMPTGPPGLLAAGMLDGRPTGDVLIYWPAPNATAGLCNFGDSTFELVAERNVSPRGPGGPTGMAAADLNGDNRLDLVLSYAESGALFIHTAGVIGDARDCFLAGAGGSQCQSAEGLRELSLADFDDDGELDILGLITEGEQLALHGGGGAASFGSVKLHPHDGRPERAAPGSLAGDPRPDIAVLDDDGRLHLLVNQSIGDQCPRARVGSAPVARADVNCEGSLRLDGSNSVDPEGEPLTYLWYQDGVLVLETDEPVTELAGPIGTHAYVLVVRDPAGNESRPVGVTLRIRDGVAPTLDVESIEPVECEGPGGARVVAGATASDECSSVVLSHSFGVGGVVDRVFPIGPTPVVWQARDGGSNITRETVEVSVVDTTPPVLDCPPLVSTDCPGTGAAEVSLVATVDDLCSGPCTLVIANDRTAGGVDASGLYPAGETLVTFQAVDEYGNVATCESRVQVVDAGPPTLTLPASPVRVECTGDGGGFAAVSATASDDCSEVLLDNDRTGGADASGFYLLGTTRVGWAALDAASNLSEGETLVEVVDTTAPSLDCPTVLIAECNGPAGAPVALRVQAQDRCDLDPNVSNDRTPSGADASDTYPLGSTPVLFEATDSAGNRGECRAFVEVQDTTPPELDCPTEIRVSCSGGAEALVALRAQVSDCCDANPAVSNDRTSGGADASGLYPMGLTLVAFEALDAAGLAATCETRVIVEDLEPPSLTCPAEVRAECSGPAGAQVAVSAVASDACDLAPVVVNDRGPGGADAGGLYPTGTTLVQFEASDAAGQVASCETRVIVEDLRAPLLGCPSLVEAECLGPAGTRVSVQAFAADACDPAPVLVNDRSAGGGDATDLYPLGDTTVRFDAVDAAGHSASCESVVRVADTLPPQVLVEVDGSCLWPPNHRFVRFRLGEELRVLSNDLCAEEADLSVEILDVLSNESEDGSGDGSTAPDVVVREDELFLRSERSGGAPGRIYTVLLLVSDPSGNSSSAEIEIRVPHGGKAPEGCKSLPKDRFFRDDEVL